MYNGGKERETKMVFMDYVFLIGLLAPCAFCSYLTHEVGNAIRSYLND